MIKSKRLLNKTPKRFKLENNNLDFANNNKRMGKHKHSKDKMHITYTQMKEDWQGKKDKKKIPFVKLPFYCCALSLLPFEDPVCTKQGNVFDIYHIIPFIKKYHRCPITGQALKATDLIKMNWSKNQKGQYQDPISYKVFTEYTHIVCIRPSGNVFAYDTIQELNKKPKFYYDLISNDQFKLDDIITIQDPKDMKKGYVAQFDYLKNNIPFVPEEKLQPEIKQNQTISRVMEQVNLKRQLKEQEKNEEFEKKKKVKAELETRLDVKGFIEWCMQNKVYQHKRQTDFGSASLTSTSFTPSYKTTTSFRDLKENEIREKIYEKVKKDKAKGFVQIQTNLGNWNVLIHCDMVPKTSENFIELAESGYYDGTEFHRLVKDFCLQGGDPSGTGSGGQSVFGKAFQDQFNPKLKHVPGVLSMANSGPCTNKSQFFICLSQQPDLDEKHSVFGELISNQQLLYQINKKLSSKSNKPKSPITIQKMICYENPFRKVIKKLKAEYENSIGLTKEEKEKKEKERWIDDKDQGFNLEEKKEKKSQTQKKDGVKNKVLEGFF